MAKWIDVAAASDIPPGQKRCVEAEGRPIVVSNIEGMLYAAANVCPHAGMPVGEGDLVKDVLTCPYHGYAYNVTTGKNVDYVDDEPLAMYAARIENDRVEVELP